MSKLEEPEDMQKLRFILNGINLIETCMNNKLITAEEKETYFASLNDKSHSTIAAMIGEL